MLRQVGQQQGMMIHEPVHIQMDDDETNTYASTLRENLNEQVEDENDEIFIQLVYRFNSSPLLSNHVELIVIMQSNVFVVLKFQHQQK